MAVVRSKPPRAPATLSAEAKRIWRNMNAEWTFDGQALLILKVALEAYDRLQEARRILDAVGCTYTTGTGFEREHPLVKIEKEARNGFLAAWRMLNLDIEPPGETGRPPGS